MKDYKNVQGFCAALQWDAKTARPILRVWHEELTREFDTAMQVMRNLQPDVEVLYPLAHEEERPFAEAHASALRNHGLSARACPV